MNILLANMPIRFNSQENLEPPLGVAYLASALRDAGHKVYLKDFEIERFSADALGAFISDKKIALAGLSFRTASFKSAKEFAAAVRKMGRAPLLVAGGHHATAFPEHTMEQLGCDIVVQGEAEETIIKLVRALEDKQPIEQVNGIAFRRDGKIVKTPKAPPVSDLDKLLLPARDLLPMDRYNAVTILTSRGCPFGCIYCDKGVSTRQVKYRSAQSVYQEILEVIRKYPGKRVYFVDDHFFLEKKRLNKIFDLIDESGLKFSWVCQARADGIGIDVLKRAKAAGCELIMYGVESGDPAELEYIRKQTTVEEARRTLLATKKAGIRARANFMLGFPISTHRTVKNTILFAGSVPIDIVRFFSVAPLPNTELWDRVYGKDADLNRINWDELDFYTPSYATAELSREDILNYSGAAYVHVLKKKVLMELFVTFLPRFIRLYLSAVREGRLRGNLSLAFPSTVNLLLDLKTISHSKNLYKRISFLARAVSLERGLRINRGKQ